ncbi:hypothetical protein AAZX31_08G098000 [Glycine max]|nr:F-box/FBD/LRR-repeat protein [Glycine max]
MTKILCISVAFKIENPFAVTHRRSSGSAFRLVLKFSHRCEKMADCDDEHVNRIGDLPMNVIVSILQRLPFQDLVKTSVLARAWRYMWSSTPRREFRDDFFEKCNHLGYLETSAIITEALLLHTGPIHVFAVIPPPHYPIKLECLNKWILFLSRKGVKYIGLASEQEDPY